MEAGFVSPNSPLRSTVFRVIWRSFRVRFLKILLILNDLLSSFPLF